MQNSFCSPEGALYRSYGEPIPDLGGLVGRIAGLVAQARERSVPILYTRQSHRPGYPDVGGPVARHRDRLIATGALLRGSWDAEIVDELTPNPDEVVVDKIRYDAFHATELDPLLRMRGVRRLILCGVVTNACVETTARSAAMRDYQVVVVPSCCGSRTEEFHRMSIAGMEAFGIATVDDTPFSKT